MTDDPQPRILRIRVRLATKRRVIDRYVKIPYGSVYEMNVQLGHLMMNGRILWFRVDRATGQQIAAHRNELVRWEEALVP